jgi:hypothetical protein
LHFADSSLWCTCVCAWVVGCEWPDIARRNAERRPLKMFWRFHGVFAYELIEATAALLAHGFHARNFELRQCHFDNALCGLFGLAVVKLPRGRHATRSLIPWRGTNSSYCQCVSSSCIYRRNPRASSSKRRGCVFRLNKPSFVPFQSLECSGPSKGVPHSGR